ncbi:hypothetical protein ACIQNG_02430 [Streptomyces sp. NPDC091377]|uniref:hypothetical protein n=1 Tax=unclassified Streptomyces TaxID=2593676 RepID=UPI00381BDC68
MSGRTGLRRCRVLALPVLAVLLTGCGIRATEVPTDFGAAPSRAHCTPAGPEVTARAAPGFPAQVFLLCRSSLVTVDRQVAAVPQNTTEAVRRVQVAQGLLDQLAEAPSAAEKEAGYTTEVPEGLVVSGPHGRDPGETLRLSVPPADLTAYALSQIVCTFSDSEAAEGDGSVVLGGPRNAVLRYECTDDVRTRPGIRTPPATEVTPG